MKNPITTLSDLFSKLVIEHGSAVIQTKQISLFKDELAILKGKFLILETENTNLKTKNQNLKTKAEQLYKIAYHNNFLQESTFIDPPGYYTHPKFPYPMCPSCLIKTNSKSPVSKEGYCTVCKEPMSGTLGEVFNIPDSYD